jgi:GNAT superfamily N-acetyltransferase
VSGAEGAGGPPRDVSDPVFRRLADADEPVVREWLRIYLEEHAAWWLEGRGLAGEVDPAEIVARRGLVTRDWTEFATAARGDDDDRLVEVAQVGGAPAGMVAAVIRPDHQLGLRGGVLQWLFVDPAHRGTGLAGLLVARATAWFDARDVQGAELFVTAANAGAVRVYERAGFAPVDHRLFRPAVRGPAHGAR